MSASWDEQWRAAIARCFPAYEVSALDRVPTQGADSEVAVANVDWIFRQARRPEVIGWFEKENALLPKLAKTLPARVPIFDLACMTHGLVGYRMVSGEPLTRDFAESAGSAATARALGRFVSKLHAFPTQTALGLGVPVNPLGVPASSIDLFEIPMGFDPRKTAHDNRWRVTFESARDRTAEELGALLSSADRKALRESFDAVLADPEAFDFSPVLVHTELHPEHVLFEADGRMAGVIDWSDASIGDPVADLALAAGYSPEFRQAFLDAYGHALDPGLERRGQLGRLVGDFLHLRHGKHLSDAGIIEEAVERVRRDLEHPLHFA